MKLKILKNNNHVTNLCIGFLAVSIFAYMYFLSLSVVHVVMRKEGTHQLSQLRSEIANLEASYIEAKHKISAQVATLDGYNTTQEKVFINKEEQSLVLRSTTE